MDASELQIKRIVLNRMDRCGTCHHVFVPDDIHVISRKPDLWMMLVECTECHARNFVAAVLNDGDPQEAQLALRQLSESAAQEAHASIPEKQPPAPPITVDDVLDIHEFLQDFDGDFKRLFDQSRRSRSARG